MISWVILAGGRASRMGGEDKGLIKLNGKPLIEYVLNVLHRQVGVGSIFINANRNIEHYSSYAPVLSDEFSGFQGPLAGIQACLEQIETEWVGFVPCDSPNISAEFISRMSAQLNSDADILVAHDGEYPQPVFSIWHKRALPRLTAYLKNGDRKVKLLLQQCHTEYVDFSDTPSLFVNLNTRDELTSFEKNQ